MLIPKHTVLINAPRQLKALEGPFKTTKGFPDDMLLVYWGLTGDISFPGMHTSILHEHRTPVLLERHKSLGVEEEGHWHGRMSSQPNSGHWRNPVPITLCAGVPNHPLGPSNSQLMLIKVNSYQSICILLGSFGKLPQNGGYNRSCGGAKNLRMGMWKYSLWNEEMGTPPPAQYCRLMQDRVAHLWP